MVAIGRPLSTGAILCSQFQIMLSPLPKDANSLEFDADRGPRPRVFGDGVELRFPVVLELRRKRRQPIDFGIAARVILT